MTTQHTPGPWRIGPTQHLGGDRQLVTILAGRGDTRWGVCDIQVDRPQDHEQQSANARLIAAAPDILAALKTALATIENTLRARNYQDGECTDPWSTEVRIEVATRASLRAVIAKAEGREG